MLRNKWIFIAVTSVILLAVFLMLSYFIAFENMSEKSYGSGSIEVRAADENTITENTILTFVYNYADGITEVYDSLPANYMRGWGREDLISAYDKWTMDSYSPEKVVFHKDMQKDSRQHYTLKEINGYVGIYDANGIKEVTSANIFALDEEERKKYLQGIEIIGDDELARVLENLES